MTLKPYLSLVGCLLLALIAGYLGGRIHGAMLRIPDTPIVITRDTRPTIPVVTIEYIADGVIAGNITGHVRVFGGTQMMVPHGSGSFRIPLSSLKRVVAVDIPQSMHYVASRTGTRAYLVHSPQGSKLKPANRVYFADAASAIKAGYKVSP